MGNLFTAKGVISKIYEPQSFKKSTKTELVIKTNDEVFLKFDVWDDVADALYYMGEGIEVMVTFLASSAYWEKGDKWFTNLSAKSIVDINNVKPEDFGVEEEVSRAGKTDYSDDLPF